MKASKKPVVIDYHIYEGVKTSVKEWVSSFNEKFEDHFINKSLETLSVKTLEGTSYDLIAGRDVIIRGIKGEYYPCRKDIFYDTHNLL